MKGGNAARCKRMLTTLGMSRPAPIKPRCNTPAICSRRVRVILIRPSDCADAREHWQDDVANERRRKQPERRAGRDENREQPATPATSESEPPALSRALARDCQ